MPAGRQAFTQITLVADVLFRRFHGTRDAFQLTIAEPSNRSTKAVVIRCGCKKMGGKKKSLANRLAKMTDEERQRYMQHKADQEEEQRRRKEQLINIFLKNKIKREDAFARLNIAKLNENWHQLLRKIKCKQMREEVTYMQEHVDRFLNFKNRTIQKLLAELDEAEEQYTNNFQSHLTYINKTMEFSRKALDDIHEEFDEQVEQLLGVATNERRTLMGEAFDQEVHLKTLMFQFEHKTKKELRENYDYYFKISDDVLQQNKKEFDEMRNAKERQITKLWLDIGKYLQEFITRTDVRRARLAELNSSDIQSNQEIENNEKQLQLKQAQLERLEKYFETLQRERQIETGNLHECVANIKRQLLRHKVSTHKKLQEDERNLQYLTAHSNDTIAHLEQQHTTGERLLQLALICRKYEAQAETATRFASFTQVDDELLRPLRSPSDEEDDEDEPHQLAAILPASSPVDGALHEAYARVKKMEGFWRYYNKIHVNLMAMRQQKAGVQRENEALKREIKLLMERRVDEALDERLAHNARTAGRNMFVVCRPATTSVRSHQLCLE